MSNREELELAAKADGISGEYVTNINGDYYYGGSTEGILCRLPDHSWHVWNPLQDDGDALRLAVKLGIGFQPVMAKYAIAYLPDGSEITEHTTGFDIEEATRRAIVRAAAEIGRGMK